MESNNAMDGTVTLTSSSTTTQPNITSNSTTTAEPNQTCTADKLNLTLNDVAVTATPTQTSMSRVTTTTARLHRNKHRDTLTRLRKPKTGMVGRARGFLARQVKCMGRGCDRIRRMCMDSGATAHYLCKHHAHLIQSPRQVNKCIVVANGATETATEAGNALVTPISGGQLSLTDAIACPFFDESLISVSRLIRDRAIAHFELNNSYIQLHDGTRIPIEHDNNTFYISIKDDCDHDTPFECNDNHARQSRMNDKDHETLKLWHARLGDASCKTISKMINHKLATGLPQKLSVTRLKHFCPVCAQSKLRKRDRGKSTISHPVYAVGQAWSADIFGPITLSCGKKFWVYIAVEKASRFTYACTIYDKQSITLIKCIKEILTDILTPLTH